MGLSAHYSAFVLKSALGRFQRNRFLYSAASGRAGQEILCRLLSSIHSPTRSVLLFPPTPGIRGKWKATVEVCASISEAAACTPNPAPLISDSTPRGANVDVCERLHPAPGVETAFRNEERSRVFAGHSKCSDVARPTHVLSWFCSGNSRTRLFYAGQ